MTEQDIKQRLGCNDALFNNIFLFRQQFDIVPQKEHYGLSIAYQDIQELRKSFLSQLVDTVVDWVYSSEKFAKLQMQFAATGKTPAAAASEVVNKAKQKFRTSDDKLLIQGQLGELVLFNFIQHVFHAIPLLRKMPITTSSDIERFGSDAIHYTVRDDKNIIILGEAKAYTSEYAFNSALEASIASILSSYNNFRDEMNLYLHEDFVDKEADQIAEAFLSNTLPNTQIELVCLVMYDESTAINVTNEADIQAQIEDIIKRRYASYDNSKIDVSQPKLRRITYAIFPVWKFKELATEFSKLL